MLMLCADSSSQAATAALFCDGELLCEYTQNQKKTHSVKMLPMIEQMLKDVDASLSDIDIFACGVGPGSFTGLRIGVATVRGFAKTLQKKCVSVNSLEILANNASGFSGKIIPLIFARENECYCSVFKDGQELLSPTVLTLLQILDLAKDEETLFLGDGAVINRKFFEENMPNARFLTGRNNMILASSLGEVALKKIKNDELCDAEGLIPLYLRKSQAEREYDEKLKNRQQ